MNRYLIISSEFPPGPGGIGKHAYSVAKSLAYHHNLVDVICDIDYANNEDIERFIGNKQENISIRHIKRRRLYTYIDRILKSLNAVKSNKYSKIIVTGKFSVWIGGILKLIFGNKIIVDCFIHGSEVKPRSRIQRTIFYYCINKMNKIWAVSHFTKSLLPTEILKLNRTYVLPNGLNLADWPDTTILSNPLNWAGYPKLLTVGSISFRKGQHCVIRSLPEVIKKFPDIHYHIVGMPINADYIIRLSVELGISKHITIHGLLTQKELVQAYQSADIFCMLSENQSNGDVEGFGIAILEANIMGLPAIGSKGCGIEDAIQDGLNGYLIDPNNKVDFVHFIDLLLQSNHDQLQNDCIGWAHKHDWNCLVENLL